MQLVLEILYSQALAQAGAYVFRSGTWYAQRNTYLSRFKLRIPQTPLFSLS